MRYRETKVVHVLEVASLPPEDVFVDRDLESLNLDDARFVAHRVWKTKSELLRMGYPKNKLDDVAPEESDHSRLGNTETIARNYLRGFEEGFNRFTADDESETPMQVFRVLPLVDFDGTGISQFRRVVVIGDEVFENEEVDYQPLVAMSAVCSLTGITVSVWR